MKKNKLFELSWSWFEDYISYLFLHENKTKSDFDADVKFLMRKYGEEYLDEETGWVGASSWIDFISKKMPELGYEEIRTNQFDFFGSFIIGNDGVEDETKGDDMLFKELVGKKLFNKAIAKNKKLTKAQIERIKNK